MTQSGSDPESFNSDPELDPTLQIIADSDRSQDANFEHVLQYALNEFLKDIYVFVKTDEF